MLVTFDMVSGATRCERTSSDEEQLAACPRHFVPHIGLALQGEAVPPLARPPHIADLDTFLNKMAAYR